VERDLTAHVQASVSVVQQHLNLFQSQHPKETGRAFGVLLESFLMEEIEAVFRSGESGKMKQFSRYWTSSRIVS
jgi:hypothetical protein